MRVNPKIKRKYVVYSIFLLMLILVILNVFLFRVQVKWTIIIFLLCCAIVVIIQFFSNMLSKKIKTSMLPDEINTTDLTASEKISYEHDKVEASFWDNQLAIGRIGLHMQIAQTVVVVLSFLSPISLAIIDKIPSQPQPFGYIEDYKDLQKIYDDCLNAYSNFQDEYRDVQKHYVALESINNDCVNAYNNLNSIEFADNSSEFVKIYSNFSKAVSDIIETNSSFNSEYEMYLINYGAFKKKYVYKFLDGNGNIISSYEPTEERILTAHVFRNLSDMSVELSSKFADKSEKFIDVGKKNSVGDDMSRELGDKLQEVQDVIQEGSNTIAEMKP